MVLQHIIYMPGLYICVNKLRYYLKKNYTQLQKLRQNYYSIVFPIITGVTFTMCAIGRHSNVIVTTALGYNGENNDALFEIFLVG